MQLLTVLALLPAVSLAITAEEPKTDPPCTIRSATTGSLFDFKPISLSPPKKDDKKTDAAEPHSWEALGYDYGANFTINFCAPVLEDLEDVVGVEEKRWQNVSAFYKKDGHTYSIGQQSATPVFRGRKLVLNYTDGSPCDIEKSANTSKAVHRKSSIFSFLCERDPAAPEVVLSFVGTSPDECAYFFEVKTPAACGGASDTSAALGPGGVFGVIALIALLVYIVGGCVYQRSVMHARGWRQIPHYSLWARIGGFVSDMFIILTSSCMRILPLRRGYQSVPTGRGAYSDRNGRDEENRLIDDLDEEWGD